MNQRYARYVPNDTIHLMANRKPNGYLKQVVRQYEVSEVINSDTLEILGVEKSVLKKQTLFFLNFRI